MEGHSIFKDWECEHKGVILHILTYKVNAVSIKIQDSVLLNLATGLCRRTKG